jgi:HK97 family phage major capsid protein
MDELVKEMQGTLALLRQKGDEAEQERKRFGDVTAETKAAIDRMNERLDGIEAEMKRPAGGADAEKSERKAAFMEYVRKGLREMAPEHKATLVGGTTSGDILVPEDLWAEIQRSVPKFTVMRQLVTVRPTRSDRIRRRTLTELAMQWGSWENAESTASFSDFTPAEAFLYVEDLYGITKIGENELADTDANLETILVDSFSRAEAEAVDSAIIAGAGHASNEPEGVLTASGITTVTASGPGAVTADDLIALPYGVASQYRANGRYVIPGTLEHAARILKDSNGQYLWQPSLVAGAPSAFNGYPVVIQDDVPAVPASGTAGIAAVFGDFRSGYALLERSGMTVQRLNELYAEDGLVGFKAHRRVGGGVIRTASFAKLNVPAA